MRERPTVPNLLGDRDVEWSWVASRIPPGPGHALDFGTGGGPLPLLMANRGWDVTALDLSEVRWPFAHEAVRFIRGDVLDVDLPINSFDLVVNCSSVEHVGLAGRYGVTRADPDGDLKAMKRLRELMKEGATMLLTVPAGKDGLFSPLCRVYGSARLPKLVGGFRVQEETFWIKDDENRWILTGARQALEFPAYAGSWNPLQNCYALACLVLAKKT